MGNATSNTNHRPSGVPNRRLDHPNRPTQSSQSPHISQSSNHTTHPSLRTKKKSLELPDLASLALSSSQGSPYSGSAQYGRQLPTSSPIPIPISPHVNPSSRNRPQQEFFSTQQLTDAYITQPSTHIPLQDRPRGNPHIRGAPLPYNSTYSFTSNDQHNNNPRMTDPSKPPLPFIPETVHSTIPIALSKAQQEQATSENAMDQSFLVKKDSPSDDPKEPVPVKITWNGGGKSVVLARAGDDNWKGRRPMEREYVSVLSSARHYTYIAIYHRKPPSDVWFTWVHLLPGTHHFRFLVDDQWRVADDLPTAVDDEGTLANYVGVALFTPPTTSAIPSAPAPPKIQAGQSFWSSSSSTGDGSSSGPDDRRSGRPRWTSEFPPELLAAAREEEVYLTATASVPDSASACSVPAPNIPPAPTLPRHLDKLILNVKPATAVSAATRPRDREREREDRRGGSRKPRSSLGMTSTTAGGETVETVTSPATVSGRACIDASGLADDTSVLPVPSHVVLQHLSTSAIRNGVLAVGNTTRYRKKVKPPLSLRMVTC